MRGKVFRTYRRLSHEEQEKTDFPSDHKCMMEGIAPISITLGFDPFVVAVDRTWEQLTHLEKISLSENGD
jgi:hypothetical protein